ncbi:peptidoglycan-binding protein [Streptomyces sp. NPDC049040]|uniref:peptidoglycan-binding domain-containing protein n=1 Tax=Streptomyces sp. NPDC049040 TaxID=3365593 RepID=UPI0037184471
MDGRGAAGEFAVIVRRPVARGGMEPPDVIDVPLPGARRPWRERPLLLCSLAVAGVSLAAVIGWQLWPQSHHAPLAEKLGAAPVAPRLGAPAATGPSAPAPRRIKTADPSPPRRTPPEVPAAGPRVLLAGSRGPDVTELQRLLFDQGFIHVSQTGVFDAATVRGVRQLQSDRGLICDPPGVYGICTRAALTS